LDVSSVAALRASIQTSQRSGEAAWIRLDGHGVEDGSTHSALCHTLTRFGLGADTGRKVPAVAVLDWSTVATCSAEGVAFFAVLVGHLIDKGVHVIACRPASATIAEVLDRSGILAAYGALTWVPCACAKGSAVETLATAAIFASESNESVNMFCDDLSAALRQLALPRATSRAVMGTTQELLHNVLSHANATHAAATALLLSRRRPKILQIGIADDGVGIAAAVLRDGRHDRLQWFHDVGVTEVVLHQALSGRPATSESGKGGGLARIVRRLLSETASTIIVRSGAALLAMRSTAPDQGERRALTYGAGTQVRVELRLS
jgi:hypothetical protein